MSVAFLILVFVSVFALSLVLVLLNKHDKVNNNEDYSNYISNCYIIFGNYVMVRMHDKHLLWQIKYWNNSKKISIGCEFKSKKDWDYFFSDNSKEEFTTKRYTTGWYILKYRYEYFIKYLEKEGIDFN